MKNTKILCTVGPSSNTKERLVEMYNAGMNVVRVNTSHADQKTLLEVMEVVRGLNREVRFPVPVLLDTHGTDIRIESLERPIDVREGEDFELRFGGDVGRSVKGARVSLNVFGAMKKGAKILVDDGTIELEAAEVGPDWALCKVRTAGTIKSRKAVNIPDLEIDLSDFSRRDYEYIKFAIENGVELITLSFVRHAKEVEKVRELADTLRSHIFIISKIEDANGVRNIDEIVGASDGIMIARGDLGAEIPLEEVPIVQQRIIDKCRAAGKVVIVATQMMESMIENPVPTRAEVSDVANAVRQMADIVMLSAETSVGKHPVRCVQAMSRICERMEREERFVVPSGGEDRSLREEITISASMLARNIGASAIIVFTRSGRLSRLSSKHRPATPIFAFTQYADVREKLTLSRGVYPYMVRLADKSHQNTDNAIATLKSDGLVRTGDMVVIISDVFKSHKDSQIIEVKKVE